MESSAMTNGNQVARTLLERLLSGERGEIPLHLSMLLEKSSTLDGGNEHYQQILPPELGDLRLDPNVVDEITNVVCDHLIHNPESDLLFTVATTGDDRVTHLAVKLLVTPPRLLTSDEHRQLLGIVSSYLIAKLLKNPEFITTAERSKLLQVLNKLEFSDDVSIRHHAKRLAGALDPKTDSDE
jgi:hypothetical protein